MPNPKTPKPHVDHINNSVNNLFVCGWEQSQGEKVFRHTSFDLVLLKVGIDYLLNVLVILHDIELVETVAEAQASDVVLEWGRVDSACQSTDAEE